METVCGKIERWVGGGKGVVVVLLLVLLCIHLSLRINKGNLG